jgi:hypothetical protein
LIEFGEPTPDERSAFENAAEIVIANRRRKRSTKTAAIEQKNAVTDSEAESLASERGQVSCARRKPSAD